MKCNDFGKIRYINPQDMWDMSTDEVISVMENSWSKELVDKGKDILKSRKNRILKALEKV